MKSHFTKANSIISNGQISNLNTFDFCGNPKVAMANNTIAKNTVNSTNGSIIYAVNTRDHNLSLESNFLLSPVRKKQFISNYLFALFNAP